MLIAFATPPPTSCSFCAVATQEIATQDCCATWCSRSPGLPSGRCLGSCFRQCRMHRMGPTAMRQRKPITTISSILVTSPGARFTPMTTAARRVSWCSNCHEPNRVLLVPCSSHPCRCLRLHYRNHRLPPRAASTAHRYRACADLLHSSADCGRARPAKPSYPAPPLRAAQRMHVSGCEFFHMNGIDSAHGRLPDARLRIASIRVNNRSGHHTGVLARWHFYLDDIFPASLAKPLVGQR